MPRLRGERIVEKPFLGSQTVEKIFLFTFCARREGLWNGEGKVCIIRVLQVSGGYPFTSEGRHAREGGIETNELAIVGSLVVVKLQQWVK